MKQYTSKFLKTVALGYMGFPIAYILVCALLFDVPAAACARALLSPWYYVLSVLAVAVGYGLWEMKRWAWYLFVVANVLIGYENAVMANQYGESHHPLAAFGVSILMLVLLTYRVSREVRVPYFFPKIRWWESNPRYRLSVPVTVIRGDSAKLAADIMDLSMGGCFIKIRDPLAQHEAVRLEFTVFGLPIHCEGTIVWLTQSTVTHPKGVGIKFAQLTRSQRRTLRVVNNRLKKIAAFYKRSRYLLNQEEFLKRLQELESAALPQPNKQRTRVG